MNGACATGLAGERGRGGAKVGEMGEEGAPLLARGRGGHGRDHRCLERAARTGRPRARRRRSRRERERYVGEGLFDLRGRGRISGRLGREVDVVATGGVRERRMHQQHGENDEQGRRSACRPEAEQRWQVRSQRERSLASERRRGYLHNLPHSKARTEMQVARRGIVGRAREMGRRAPTSRRGRCLRFSASTGSERSRKDDKPAPTRCGGAGLSSFPLPHATWTLPWSSQWSPCGWCRCPSTR